MSRNETVPAAAPGAAQAAPPETSLGLICNNTALRRASRQLGQLYDDALAPLGLKATQFGLLVQIDRLTAASEGDGPTLQSLAEHLAIQISALTHALRPLVRDGLVAVRPDGKDKRSKRALLTATGRDRLGKAVAHWARANETVDTVLGADVARGLRVLADRISSDGFLDAYRAGKPLTDVRGA